MTTSYASPLPLGLISAAGDDMPIAEALLALPLSLTAAENAQGALVATSGRQGWPDRLEHAIEEGARGVLVELPTRVPLTEIDRIRSLAVRVPVLLRRPYLSNPIFAQLGDAGSTERGTHLVASEQYMKPPIDVREALFDHLSVNRIFTRMTPSIDSVVVDSNGYTVTGTTPTGAPVIMGGVVSAAEPARITASVLSPPVRFRLELPTDETSRPATVVTTNADGTLSLPTTYESPQRAAWRMLVAVVRDGRSASDIANFCDDLHHFDAVLTVLARQHA